MKKQITNPYIRFRRKAEGRYANKIGDGVFGRAITTDETQCFFIADAQMGVQDSNVIEICFNKDHQNCTTGWTFKKNGVAFTNVGIHSQSQPCIRFTADDGTENTSAGPNDTITLDYAPGTCGAVGEQDCTLEALTDYPVQNNIFGPATARVNPDRDNVVVVVFQDTPQTIGNSWSVKVNTVVQTISNSAIVGNNIELTIGTSVNQGDTVLYTHNSTGTPATAVDGRNCYWFFDQPVVNAVGSEYWIQEAGAGFWLLEGSLGGWQIE